MSIQKKIKRILTILLCGALLFGIVPNAATADELSATKENSELSAASETSEVVSLREENIKHFDMGDGTYQAIVYSHPVHELDEDGTWQDIDFSLSLTGTRGNQKYINRAAGVAFADQYEAGKPVMSLSKDGNAIDLTLLSASTSSVAQRVSSAPIAATVKNPESKFKTIEEANQAIFSSSILYKDVVPSVDLEYIVDPGLIKENIIVKETSDTYRYVFSLNLIGMYPVLQDNGSIYLFDNQTDEKIYIIPAPYMYDAAGYESEAVEYTILGSGNTYSLVVTADANWINAENRSLPVTIDPSIVSDGATATGDTYTNSEDPNANFGSRWVLWIRSTRTSYIKLPTPSIPDDDAELNWASLTGFYYYYAGVTYGQTNISAHRIVGSWSQNTLTWNTADNMPGNNGLATRTLSSGTCYANKGAIASDPEIITFDITELAQQWLDGTYPNYGVGLKFKTNSTNQSVVIKSTNAESQYRPRIIYEYSITNPGVDIRLFGVTNQGHDHISSLNAVSDTLEEYGYENCTVSSGAFSPDEFKKNLKRAEIVTTRSHGKRILGNNDELQGVGLWLNDSESMQHLFLHRYISCSATEIAYITNQDDFSNLDLCLFIGCQTALDGADGENLVSRIVDRGCKTAIGFTDEIDCEAANAWTQMFYTALLSGKTVEDAVEDASNQATAINGLESVFIDGDELYTIDN